MQGLKSVLFKTYKRTFDQLPAPVRAIISRVDFSVANRPVCDAPGQPEDRLERGAVVISLDFEMAWGWHHAVRKDLDLVAKGLWEREQVPRLLQLFAEHDIPATWAAVGHLFLEKCERGVHGLAHEEMPRLQHLSTPLWEFTEGDWYACDPCTDVKRDPAWYAPDLVEQILSSRVKHEIGSHSFSHASFGVHCPPDVAAAEVEACALAMASFGLKPTTWVFPRHDSGNHAALAAKGVRIIRSDPELSLRVSLPKRRQDGLWEVPVSSGIERGKEWTLEQRLTRLKTAVAAAARTGLSAHVWLHPSLSAEEMEQVLVPLLAHCASMRDRGLIDILTMGQLVEATELRRKRMEKPLAQRAGSLHG